MPALLPTPQGATRALDIAQARGILPLSIGTEEIRATLSPAIRARAVWAARANHARFLEGLKAGVEGLLQGGQSIRGTKAGLRGLLASLGYTPEGAFPSMGDVPPAVAGSIRDLSSDARLNLILETQVALMRNAALKIRGENPARMKVFPFWELVRVTPRAVPREWEDRWARAGGELLNGRMIAPKASPLWESLGDSSLFDDALDVSTPPFAFNSGMGWVELSREEVGPNPPAVVPAPPSTTTPPAPEPSPPTGAGAVADDEPDDIREETPEEIVAKLPTPAPIPTANRDRDFILSLKRKLDAGDAPGGNALSYRKQLEERLRASLERAR